MSSVKLDTRKLNDLLKSLPGDTNKIVGEAAVAVEQQAKVKIMEWPLIDTGALVNSIVAQQDEPGKWVVGDQGGYDGSKPSRFGKRIGMKEYAVFWELGHRNLFTRHYMRMPFLGPAVVEVEKNFAERFKDLFK
jgi:hypothetical protein